ncbi:MAG: hypothetical protein KDK62_03525 [Chlamydiia bacterium]|nr:hypothetical protein [Chlamydiia bacterium]
MGSTAWENVFNRVVSGYETCKTTLSTWKSHTVTLIQSGAVKPGVIGLSSIALSVAMVALALFLTIKAIAFCFTGTGLILSGVGIAPGCALLGWSALTATGALTVGLLALVPFATALGGFLSARDLVHSAFHPTLSDAESA